MTKEESDTHKHTHTYTHIICNMYTNTAHIGKKRTSFDRLKTLGQGEGGKVREGGRERQTGRQGGREALSYGRREGGLTLLVYVSRTG